MQVGPRGMTGDEPQRVTSGTNAHTMCALRRSVHRSLRREFAADGQRFYFTVARDESDIWVMEIGRNR